MGFLMRPRFGRQALGYGTRDRRQLLLYQLGVLYCDFWPMQVPKYAYEVLVRTRGAKSSVYCTIHIESLTDVVAPCQVAASLDYSRKSTQHRNVQRG